MREARTGGFEMKAVARQRVERGLRTDSAQPNDYPHARQHPHLAFQVRKAAPQLLARGCVLRRSAPQRRGDDAIAQLQTVVRRERRRPACEARAIQCGIKKIAGRVAGEHPPRAIAPVRAGREPHQHQTRERIAERRNRSAPVRPVAVRALFLVGNATAVGAQFRTFRAAHHGTLQSIEFRYRH